ncbi:sugar efflux transporter [Actinobacillus capsulatus]|uniref:sugar efflux transporter n=1 Tax=Actinobacillus capsulatus TaxID=717 RepID=UPI0009DA4349|nr:sugar efflux transporter [Actinobacillus capsulatus]
MQNSDNLRLLVIQRGLLRSASFAFLIVIFMTGLAGALRVPALSVFLHDEVTNNPFMIGIFYSVNSLMAMVLSQIVAHYSDLYTNRKWIITLSCVMQLSGCLLFAFNRDYYTLLIVGTLIIGLGSSATSQVFALSREYTESKQKDGTMFNTILRAQLSLAWIIGPPVAYYLSGNFGFTFMYIVAALIFAVSILIVVLMLPYSVQRHVKPKETDETLRENGIESNRKSTIFLALACLLMWTCNSMMFINLPLHLKQNLHLSEQVAGVMMSTAAAIEIPVMLFAGYCTRFISKKMLLIIAILAGIYYYIGLSVAQTESQLLALQVFNGLFIGILASIGMLYFQDLMPYKMGSATTLFNNTSSASWVIAGPVAGMAASYFGYQSTWYLSLILCLVSLLVMLPVRKL